MVEEGRPESQLVWIDLDGRSEPFGRRHEGMLIAVRPHGDRRVVYDVHLEGATSNPVWAYDTQRGVSTHLFTVDVGSGFSCPLPDGRIAFSDFMTNTTVVYPGTGRGEPEALADGVLIGTTPDGHTLLLADFSSSREPRLMWDDLTDDAPAAPIEVAMTATSPPTLSAAGRWMLWAHDASGEDQVYLARFPPTDEVWQVSVQGADSGLFTPAGDAILVSSTGDGLNGKLRMRRVAFR